MTNTRSETQVPATSAALDAAVREQRQRVRHQRKVLSRYAPQLARLGARLEQALAVDQADSGAARLDRLVGVLDPGHVAAHVAAVVPAAAIAADPVPHAIVAPILPEDVYGAVVEAVPPRVYFDDVGACRRELPLPPALAPVWMVVTLQFLAEAAVEVLTPALAKLFEPLVARHGAAMGLDGEAARLTGSHGRLIARLPGYVPRAPRRHTHLLTVVLALARPGGPLEAGSVVQGIDGSGLTPVTLAPNTCLVVFNPAGSHECAPVGGGGDLITYEFPIGLDGETRRRLARSAAND